MNMQVDVERLLLAQKAVRAELMAERAPDGHWSGYVASSPLATAAAISALVAAHHTDSEDALRNDTAALNESVADQVVQGDLCEFLLDSVNWLAQHQNPDGGWGDCVLSRSNIAATMLVQAAFRLTGVPAKYDDLILRADQFVATQGGIAALRRHYRDDKMLTAAVLATCAVAGTVPWSKVPTLPFEQVCLPIRWQAHVQTSIGRTGLPLMLAVGRAKFQHDPPRNPLTHLWRRSIRAKSLLRLEKLQADDDSFLASVPTTAFIVLNLASMGCRDHKIVERGVEFLLSSVRGDASWPVEANLATAATTLALDSLAGGPILSDAYWHDAPTADAGEHELHAAASSHEHSPTAQHPDDDLFSDRCLEWLLATQCTTRNAITDVSPGGWSSSDAAGALPNSSDTANVLLTLAHWPRSDNPARRDRIDRAARLGVAWLLDLQNEDGGWPTFYRRAGGFLSDVSGTDVTSHAVRALAAWQLSWHGDADAGQNPSTALSQRIDAAVERGWRYLESAQREDGSFVPLWFGNEFQPENPNPVIGTAKVLLMCHDLSRSDWGMANRAVRWMLSAQHTGGGWGPPRAPVDYSGAEKDGFQAWRANESMAKLSSVEETALAVSALLPLAVASQPVAKAASAGLTWLANAIEQEAHRRPAAIGFYPSKIWYHERLYPLAFAETALSRALQLLAKERPAATHVG
jgi:squalene-hopene/tetraprenyl-beta-curcumene cyclase